MDPQQQPASPNATPEQQPASTVYVDPQTGQALGQIAGVPPATQQPAPQPAPQPSPQPAPQPAPQPQPQAQQTSAESPIPSEEEEDRALPQAPSIITQEQLDELVKSVRTNANNRLYSKISSLENQLRSMRGSNQQDPGRNPTNGTSQPTEPQAQPQSAPSQPSQLVQDSSGNVLPTSLPEGKSDTMTPDLQSQFNEMLGLIQQLDGSLTQERNLRLTSEMNATRERIINDTVAEAQKDGVPLTREFLDSSLPKASPDLSPEVLLQAAANARAGANALIGSYKQSLPEHIRQSFPAAPIQQSTSPQGNPGPPESSPQGADIDPRSISAADWGRDGPKIKETILKKHGLNQNRAPQVNVPRGFVPPGYQHPGTGYRGATGQVSPVVQQGGRI